MLMTIFRGDLGLRGVRCGDPGGLSPPVGMSKRLVAVTKGLRGGPVGACSRGAGQQCPHPRIPCCCLDVSSRPAMNSSSPLCIVSLHCNWVGEHVTMLQYATDCHTFVHSIARISLCIPCCWLDVFARRTMSSTYHHAFSLPRCMASLHCTRRVALPVNAWTWLDPNGPFTDVDAKC